MDQNEDVVVETSTQQSDTFTNTANDGRLYDQTIGNNTFNGRNANQHLLKEDYDGVTATTPPDVLRGGNGVYRLSRGKDLHGGTRGDQTSGRIQSHQDQDVAIRCSSCRIG